MVTNESLSNIQIKEEEEEEELINIIEINSDLFESRLDLFFSC